MPAVNQQIVSWMDDLISRGNDKDKEGAGSPLTAGMDREFVIVWVTGCISCVQEVYGDSSPFYKTLQIHRDSVIMREHFLYCLGIIKEARRQYVNGYHLRLKELITGDVFDDFLLMSVDEENTQFENDNLEIEVFLVEDVDEQGNVITKEQKLTTPTRE